MSHESNPTSNPFVPPNCVVIQPGQDAANAPLSQTQSMHSQRSAQFSSSSTWVDTDGSTEERPIQSSDKFGEPRDVDQRRFQLQRSGTSYASIPPDGSVLTGKQEHYLKRELLSQQAKWEIEELSNPTALQRFGAPFKSDVGEVAPQDSDLPLLRYIFVHHVRNFPFLDKAKEKEFWQDKLQVFLESFAKKNISSSEDRLEETKRRKLALKCEKLIELMMVSGLPTASGYEERIRFAEMEIIDRGASEQGLTINVPEGQEINGWDVNVAGVRTTSIKRHVRYHTHAEFILRVKRADQPAYYVGRRFGEFAQLHRRLRTELPGKVLPPLPRKNKSNSLFTSQDYDDDVSISSESSQSTTATGKRASISGGKLAPPESGGGLRSYIPSFGMGSHRRNVSTHSARSGRNSPRASLDMSAAPQQDNHVLYRETQRVSLRAFLRTFLQREQIARSKAMEDFLTGKPIHLNEEELEDIERRKAMDKKRLEEQTEFYRIARQRAAEIDVHMEKFRRDVVERNGLTHLFAEIKQKNTIQELSPEYQKFAEWCRIEVAATIYHLFLAEDNSPEMFGQAKRIHSLIPYAVLKNVIRIANPAAVMSGVLDLFLAQPFGSRSLMQRIFMMAIGDSVRSVQRAIDDLDNKIGDPILTEKIKAYSDSSEELKNSLRSRAHKHQEDIIVTLLTSEDIQPPLAPEQTERIFNAWVAWNNAVENIDGEMRQGAELFAHLKQYLKLCVRQRDKTMLLQIIEEPTSLQLFRDLFTIFYEPLVRVYKSANVYSSITDFSVFMDDVIRTVEAAQRQDVAADPNQTVQAFIDLCARHEHNFYKFVHEVHLHDNGLFDQLMQWIEGILEFLRKGPRGGGQLDMNALFQGGADSGIIRKEEAIREVKQLVKWQMARKRWHQDKTRQKMAQSGAPDTTMMGNLRGSDFGLNDLDLEEFQMEDEEIDDSTDTEAEEDDDVDPIEAERKRRKRHQDRLRRSAGEPVKPNITELTKLRPSFLSMLRGVLAE